MILYFFRVSLFFFIGIESEKTFKLVAFLLALFKKPFSEKTNQTSEVMKNLTHEKSFIYTSLFTYKWHENMNF